MSRTFNNLIIYNGYPLSVVVAVVLHVSVLLSMLYLQFDNSSDALELVQPTIIKSLFIDENPQVTNARNRERERLERLDQQRRARERDAAEQRAAAAEAERQREEAAAQEQARIDREQQAALRERQENERQQELDRQRQRETEAEQQRQREVAEARRIQEQQRQRELEQARQAEAAAAAAAEGARTEFELVQSATGLIQQLVQENWSRPPSARNGMQAVLRISMFPTGEVTDVTIVRSSNDPAFDRSAENAVYRAAPFSELQGLPIKIFNENFRTLSLTFSPEDLLN